MWSHVHLARADKSCRTLFRLKTSLQSRFRRVRADKHLGVTHQSAVHALVFRTSQCHTENGHIRCGSREDQSQDLSVRD